MLKKERHQRFGSRSRAVCLPCSGWQAGMLCGLWPLGRQLRKKTLKEQFRSLGGSSLQGNCSEAWSIQYQPPSTNPTSTSAEALVGSGPQFSHLRNGATWALLSFPRPLYGARMRSSLYPWWTLAGMLWGLPDPHPMALSHPHSHPRHTHPMAMSMAGVGWLKA